MDLEYKMKDAAALLKSSKPQVVRVEFDPPLLGYEEVKPRLLGMKVDADEALGTVRPPPSISHKIVVNIHTFIHAGQGSANHAFRTTVPDLDHSVPPPLSDLQL